VELLRRADLVSIFEEMSAIHAPAFHRGMRVAAAGDGGATVARPIVASSRN